MIIRIQAEFPQAAQCFQIYNPIKICSRRHYFINQIRINIILKIWISSIRIQELKLASMSILWPFRAQILLVVINHR